MKLSVHKNTLAKKHRKEMQAYMMQSAKRQGTQDVRAFALVSILANGRVLADWDTGSVMPMWAFSPTIHEALRRNIEESGVEETWQPNLSERPE